MTFSRDTVLTLGLSLLSIIVFSNSAAQTSPETQIIMLGTGSPVPNPDRSGPAVAIVVDENSYLFDFGPGVVRRAAKLSPRFGGKITALAPKNIHIAFLTHLHSDHSAGFSDLLLTAWSGGHRNRPLRIFGPEGIERLVEGTLYAYETDIKYRVFGLEVTNDQGWRVETETIKEGLVFQDNYVKVLAFPVLHGSWPNAFGYRIETEDKVVVISGDLRPNDKIREYSKNADYLIHEVYCEAGRNRLDKERQNYHLSNHTSTKQLVELAGTVKPGVLVLTHILWFGCTPEEVMDEMADYPGKTILAEDLDIYK
ncbi:MAG: MBL fold metallo-hydrolase [Gammaproteobacteria bacterium]